MYCKKCGSQIDNDSVFCPKCGANQTTSLATKETDEKMNGEQVNSQNIYSNTDSEESTAFVKGEPNNENHETKKKTQENFNPGNCHFACRCFCNSWICNFFFRVISCASRKSSGWINLEID